MASQLSPRVHPCPAPSRTGQSILKTAAWVTLKREVQPHQSFAPNPPAASHLTQSQAKVLAMTYGNHLCLLLIKFIVCFPHWHVRPSWGQGLFSVLFMTLVYLQSWHPGDAQKLFVAICWMHPPLLPFFWGGRQMVEPQSVCCSPRWVFPSREQDEAKWKCKKWLQKACLGDLVIYGINLCNFVYAEVK